jgi:hypothetical protein
VFRGEIMDNDPMAHERRVIDMQDNLRGGRRERAS